ncbi:MAG: hypothetical protein AAFY71_12465 [Bacteroidota bacterium]
MKLHLAEPILDQLAAIMGVFMVMVVAYIFIRIILQKKAEIKLHQSTDGDWVSPKTSQKPVLAKKSKAQLAMVGAQEVSFGFSTAPMESHEVVSKPPRPKEEEIKTPPRLGFAKVVKAGNNLIRLNLVNIGSTMKFERVVPDKFNEVEVKLQSRSGGRGFISPKSNVSFVLTGTNLDYQTYHFKVYFKDGKGRSYVQEVAGLGNEKPIIELPESR